MKLNEIYKGPRYCVSCHGEILITGMICRMSFTREQAVGLAGVGTCGDESCPRYGLISMSAPGMNDTVIPFPYDLDVQ